MGMVYRQAGRNVWMLKYHRDGVPIVESSGTSVKTEAKKELQKREGAIANGQPLLPKAARSFRFEEAATDLENNYKIEGRRSLDEWQRRIKKHLAVLPRPADVVHHHGASPRLYRQTSSRTSSLMNRSAAPAGGPATSPRRAQAEGAHLPVHVLPDGRQGAQRAEGATAHQGVYEGVGSRLRSCRMSRAHPARSTAHGRAEHGAGRHSRRVAMKLTGHKTPSIFQRYNIVSDGELASAARMLDGIGRVAIRATP